MTRFALAFIVALLAVGLHAQEPQSIVGHYSFAGQHWNGAPYKGFMEITETQGIYRLQWGDPPSAMGVGVREGAVLSVVFMTSDHAIGLASYRIEGTTLHGQWLLPPDETSVQPEVLTKLDPRLHGAERGRGPRGVV